MRTPKKVEAYKKNDAMAAARELDTADLQKILAEKQPPSEQERVQSLVSDLLRMAKEMPADALSKLVNERAAELRALEILNVQRNVTSITFSKPELDGLLSVFLKLDEARRKELATQVQQAAVAAGLQQGAPLDTYAHKLARLGIHL